MRDIIKLLTPKSWLNFIVIQNYISSLVKNCEDTMVISTDTWVDFERRKHETVMRWTKKKQKKHRRWAAVLETNCKGDCRQDSVRRIRNQTYPTTNVWGTYA